MTPVAVTRGLARHGPARLGVAGLGLVWQGGRRGVKPAAVTRGKAWLGLARRGLAGHGWARHGGRPAVKRRAAAILSSTSPITRRRGTHSEPALRQRASQRSP
jgi:hypothetical protein